MWYITLIRGALCAQGVFVTREQLSIQCAELTQVWRVIDLVVGQLLLFIMAIYLASLRSMLISAVDAAALSYIEIIICVQDMQ